MNFDLSNLRDALAGRAAAFRCVTEYQPAGGPGAKVFPPTYEGGKYATEDRVDPSRIDPETKKPAVVPCVLLDSVQSQANRMELALLKAIERNEIKLPLVVTDFAKSNLDKTIRVTSLEAPHRIADALFRDSTLDGVIFRKSEKGRILNTADVRNATGLFGLCPTALVFGIWDSTGPRGGLGAKFQRALVSEIVGYDAEPGVVPSSRIDLTGIEKKAGPVFRTPEGNWTLDVDKALKVKGKPALFALSKGNPVPYGGKSDADIPDQGRPSKINHGNVTPDFNYAKDSSGKIIKDKYIDECCREREKPRIMGGHTISKALQSTVISLSALRRLRFPLPNTNRSNPETDLAAQTTLAAIGLAAATLAREDGDLRSRCQLFPESESHWELLDQPGQNPQAFELTPAAAINLLNEAIDAAKQAGLPWEGVVELQPSEELAELVRRSQKSVRDEGREADPRPFPLLSPQKELARTESEENG